MSLNPTGSVAFVHPLRRGLTLRGVTMLRRAASMDPGYRRSGEVWSCTESLGSESGDVGGGCDAEIVDDHQQPTAAAVPEAKEGEAPQASSLEKRRRTERRLPPAMPRAAEAFMRAERRGGRLILTEVVRADRRREVFRASRADGRLQLRFAEEEEETPDDEDATISEPAPLESTERESVATSEVVVSGCCNSGGGGGFFQVAAGAGRRLEIGAVMGT